MSCQASLTPKIPVYKCEIKKTNTNQPEMRGGGSKSWSLMVDIFNEEGVAVSVKHLKTYNYCVIKGLIIAIVHCMGTVGYVLVRTTLARKRCPSH